MKVLGVVFCCFFFVFCCDAAISCGKYACVPGVENLGRGYDLVKGELKFANVIDLETSSSTETYTSPYQNKTYGLPPVVGLVNTPSYDVDSELFRSSVDFASHKSLEVGIVFGADWDAGSLALDLEVQKVQDVLKTGDSVAVFTREIQSVYTAQLAPYDQLSLSEQFKKDLEKLPATFDAGSYQDFIDKYGTHIVQWGLFGGEAMLYSVVAADAGVTYSDLTVSLTLRLQLQVLKGSVEVSYNKDGYNVDFDNYVSYQNLSFHGGDPTVGPTNYSQWVNTVRYSPTFIRSNIVNITKFVADDVRRANLIQQINAYSQANLQQDTSVQAYPMRLAWGNTTTANITQTCQDLGQIVIGTQLDDGYESTRPYDCSTPCLSFSAWEAWQAHNWISSSETEEQNKQENKEEKKEKKRDDMAQCMSASFKCGDGMCLPGLDDLGIGFDAVFGRRKVAPVAKFTYKNGFTWTHPTTGDQYTYPDQVSVFDDVEDTTASYVISSQQDLSDYYSGHFGLRLTIPGLFTFGFGVQSSSSIYYSGESLLSLTEEDTTFYEIVVSDVEASDSLVQSVQKLPTTYNEEAYASFVDSYGTHYIEEAVFGGKTLMTNIVDQSYYSNKAEQSMGVEAGFMFGGFKAGGNVGTHYDQEYVQYDSSTFSQFNVYGGEYQYYSMNSSQSWSNWESTLTCDPAAVAQKLNSIVKLVNTIDKTKGANLNTYINQYLEKAQASFEKKAVGVAENSATGISTVDVPADLYQGCAGNGTMIAFNSYDDHKGTYYNLQPAHCTQFTWNEAALESGRAGPIFVDPNTCFQANQQTSKHYSGCPPNTFAVGCNSYKGDHNGVVGIAPFICCNLYFYPNTTSPMM